MNILCAGIDVSTTNNVVCLIDAEGKIVDKIRSFPQNQSGALALEKWLEGIATQSAVTGMRIATEATSFYDLPILDYLAESVALSKFKPELYRLNAKYIKRFRQSMGEREKTDWEDARVIAVRLMSGSLPHPYLSNQTSLPLQRLTRYRVHLVNSIAREKQYMLTHLFLKYSTYKTEGPLAKQVFGATSRAIMEEYFSAEQIANQSVRDLALFVARHGKGRSLRTEEIAKGLQAMAKEAHRIRPSLAKSVNIIIASSIRSIQALQGALKEVNRAIQDELGGFTQTLQTIPGIGPVYSAGIFAEIGDVNRFKSSDQIAKFAGLWWPRHQSGSFEAEEKRLHRAGNKYLRYYLVEAANSCRVHNPEYKQYYQKKYAEVPRHKHKRALVLSARKLVRPVYALLKRGEIYRGGNPQNYSANRD